MTDWCATHTFQRVNMRIEWIACKCQKFFAELELLKSSNPYTVTWWADLINSDSKTSPIYQKTRLDPNTLNPNIFPYRDSWQLFSLMLAEQQDSISHIYYIPSKPIHIIYKHVCNLRMTFFSAHQRNLFLCVLLLLLRWGLFLLRLCFRLWEIFFDSCNRCRKDFLQRLHLAMSRAQECGSIPSCEEIANLSWTIAGWKSRRTRILGGMATYLRILNIYRMYN